MNNIKSESPTLSKLQGNNTNILLCPYNNLFSLVLKTYEAFDTKRLYNTCKLWSKANIYKPILQFKK